MNRTEMIKWLSENTTREQWEDVNTLFFTGDLAASIKYAWGTYRADQHGNVGKVIVRPLGSTDDKYNITIDDVFEPEQPVYIDGAVYEIGLMDKEPEQFVYNVRINMFERGTNQSISASSVHNSRVVTHFKLISEPKSITDRDIIDTVKREEGHEFTRGCGDEQSSNDWGKFLTGSGVDSSPQGLLNHKRTTSALDKQEGGSHYKGKGIQPWEIIKSNDMGFFDGNALKYLMRHKDKNGAEDIKKAIHYLEAILEFEYSDVRR